MNKKKIGLVTIILVITLLATFIFAGCDDKYKGKSPNQILGVYLDEVLEEKNFEIEMSYKETYEGKTEEFTLSYIVADNGIESKNVSKTNTMTYGIVKIGKAYTYQEYKFEGEKESSKQALTDKEFEEAYKKLYTQVIEIMVSQFTEMSSIKVEYDKDDKVYFGEEDDTAMEFSIKNDELTLEIYGGGIEVLSNVRNLGTVEDLDVPNYKAEENENQSGGGSDDNTDNNGGDNNSGGGSGNNQPGGNTDSNQSGGGSESTIPTFDSGIYNNISYNQLNSLVTASKNTLNAESKNFVIESYNGDNYVCIVVAGNNRSITVENTTTQSMELYLIGNDAYMVSGSEIKTMNKNQLDQAAKLSGQTVGLEGVNTFEDLINFWISGMLSEFDILIAENPQYIESTQDANYSITTGTHSGSKVIFTNDSFKFGNRTVNYDCTFGCAVVIAPLA